MGRSAIFIQCQMCGAQTKYYIDFQIMNRLTPTQKKAIEEIQQKMNKIDLAACAEISETSLAAGAAAFAAYKDCLNTLFGK